MNPDLPGPEELITALLDQTIRATHAGSGYREEVMHTVNFIVVAHLNSLVKNERAYAQVRAIASAQLKILKAWLEDAENVPFSDAYRHALVQQIETSGESYLEQLPSIPPGSPIGMECMEYH